MNRIQGVIFDMDGLMFDTQAVWDLQWKDALAQHGINQVIPGFIEAERGTTGDSTHRIIHEYYGPDADARGIYDSLCDLAFEAFTKGAPLKPGLMELLTFLKERSVPRAVASSSPRRIVSSLLHATQTDRFFEANNIVCGSDVAHSKPAPDIFLEAAKRIGTEPAQTLVLEDSFHGVEAGAAGGFCVIMIPDLAQPDTRIKQLTTDVFDTLHQVIPFLAS